MAGLPVDLYEQPVGTKGILAFDVPHDPGTIEKAWLRMTADDIDEAKEARVTLNGKPVTVHGSVLGEGVTEGVLVLPVKAFVKGRNVLEFVFADDLGGESSKELWETVICVSRDACRYPCSPDLPPTPSGGPRLH